MKLPAELKSSKKGLFHIKNNDQKCFLWYHVRHSNPVKIHPGKTKSLLIILNYDYEFPVRQKDFSKIEKKNNICVNVFRYENKLTFPIYVSDQKFKNSMNLFLVIDANNSLYVYIKYFDRFMFHKANNKNKKHFCKSCLQCFSSKNVLTEDKEVCLSFNGEQSVRLEKVTIEFKTYFKQIPVPFKTCADSECNLKSVESYERFYSKKYQVPCSFAYKLICIDDEFTNPIFVFRGQSAAYEFIKAILKEYQYCKKSNEKIFLKKFYYE